MTSIERRAKPRYSVSCRAELASGEAVAPARIGDVSDTGCRVLILDRVEHLPGQFGETGLLSIRPSGLEKSGVVVPVTLRHIQEDSVGLHYGLEFRPMSRRQASRLADVVAGLVADRAGAPGYVSPSAPAGRAGAPA